MISDIASVASAIAVLIAAGSLLGQTRTRKFELAQVYVQRYWAIDEMLARDGRDSIRTGLYLRLCEDEFDLARQGWIDVAVWRTWHDAIRGEAEPFGPDFSGYEHLSECMKQGRNHRATDCDGLGPKRWRRRVAWWLESPLGS